MTSVCIGRSDCVYEYVTGYGTLRFNRRLENYREPFLIMHCVRNETGEVSAVKFPFGNCFFRNCRLPPRNK
jgi:hypothetical protein